MISFLRQIFWPVHAPVHANVVETAATASAFICVDPSAFICVDPDEEYQEVKHLLEGLPDKGDRIQKQIAFLCQESNMEYVDFVQALLIVPEDRCELFVKWMRRMLPIASPHMIRIAQKWSALSLEEQESVIAHVHEIVQNIKPSQSPKDVNQNWRPLIGLILEKVILMSSLRRRVFIDSLFPVSLSSIRDRQKIKVRDLYCCLDLFHLMDDELVRDVVKLMIYHTDVDMTVEHRCDYMQYLNEQLINLHPQVRERIVDEGIRPKAMYIFCQIMRNAAVEQQLQMFADLRHITDTVQCNINEVAICHTLQSKSPKEICSILYAVCVVICSSLKSVPLHFVIQYVASIRRRQQQDVMHLEIEQLMQEIHAMHSRQLAIQAQRTEREQATQCTEREQATQRTQGEQEKEAFIEIVQRLVMQIIRFLVDLYHGAVQGCAHIYENMLSEVESMCLVRAISRSFPSLYIWGKVRLVHAISCVPKEDRERVLQWAEKWSDRHVLASEVVSALSCLASSADRNRVMGYADEWRILMNDPESAMVCLEFLQKNASMTKKAIEQINELFVLERTAQERIALLRRIELLLPDVPMWLNHMPRFCRAMQEVSCVQLIDLFYPVDVTHPLRRTEAQQLCCIIMQLLGESDLNLVALSTMMNEMVKVAFHNRCSVALECITYIRGGDTIISLKHVIDILSMIGVKEVPFPQFSALYKESQDVRMECLHLHVTVAERSVSQRGALLLSLLSPKNISAHLYVQFLKLCIDYEENGNELWLEQFILYMQDFEKNLTMHQYLDALKIFFENFEFAFMKSVQRMGLEKEYHSNRVDKLRLFVVLYRSNLKISKEVIEDVSLLYVPAMCYEQKVQYLDMLSNVDTITRKRIICWSLRICSRDQSIYNRECAVKTMLENYHHPDIDKGIECVDKLCPLEKSGNMRLTLFSRLLSIKEREILVDVLLSSGMISEEAHYCWISHIIRAVQKCATVDDRQTVIKLAASLVTPCRDGITMVEYIRNQCSVKQKQIMLLNANKLIDNDVFDEDISKLRCSLFQLPEDRQNLITDSLCRILDNIIVSKSELQQMISCLLSLGKGCLDLVTYIHPFCTPQMSIQERCELLSSLREMIYDRSLEVQNAISQRVCQDVRESIVCARSLRYLDVDQELWLSLCCVLLSIENRTNVVKALLSSKMIRVQTHKQNVIHILREIQKLPIDTRITIIELAAPLVELYGQNYHMISYMHKQSSECQRQILLLVKHHLIRDWSSHAIVELVGGVFKQIKDHSPSEQLLMTDLLGYILQDINVSRNDLETMLSCLLALQKDCLSLVAYVHTLCTPRMSVAERCALLSFVQAMITHEESSDKHMAMQEDVIKRVHQDIREGIWCVEQLRLSHTNSNDKSSILSLLLSIEDRMSVVGTLLSSGMIHSQTRDSDIVSVLQELQKLPRDERNNIIELTAPLVRGGKRACHMISYMHQQLPTHQQQIALLNKYKMIRDDDTEIMISSLRERAFEQVDCLSLTEQPLITNLLSCMLDDITVSLDELRKMISGLLSIEQNRCDYVNYAHRLCSPHASVSERCAALSLAQTMTQEERAESIQPKMHILINAVETAALDASWKICIKNIQKTIERLLAAPRTRQFSRKEVQQLLTSISIVEGKIPRQHLKTQAKQLYDIKNRIIKLYKSV